MTLPPTLPGDLSVEGQPGVSLAESGGREEPAELADPQDLPPEMRAEPRGEGRLPCPWKAHHMEDDHLHLLCIILLVALPAEVG